MYGILIVGDAARNVEWQVFVELSPTASGSVRPSTNGEHDHNLIGDEAGGLSCAPS